MQLLPLLTMVQDQTLSYVGRADPRILVEMAVNSNEEGEEQYQRILSKARVEDLSNYVGKRKAGEPAILPGALILGVRKNSALRIRTITGTLRDESGRESEYKMAAIDFPETPEEARQYPNTIDILDGQHRLFSFSEGIVKLDPDTPYEMNFTLYDDPSLAERRMIFRTANENQKPVNGNLLMWFREKLGLLKPVEKNFHPIITMLNEREDSPLFGRIIMGDERIPKGYKGQQLIMILEKAKIGELSAGNEPLDQDALYRLLSTYLRAWADACGSSFISPKTGETSTKISAIRYMLFMLPTFWNEATDSAQKFNAEFLSGALQQLAHSLAVQSVSDIFAPESFWSYAFRGEGATVKLAEDHAKLLKRQMQDQRSRSFNPLS